MASVSLQGVAKRFGGTTVVQGVDCEIADGELNVILGPSGCGKSTLLRLVAGLEQLSDGTILIGGRDVSRVEPKDRDIAMVFQTYALYPHMTVYDNMAYGLRIRGLPKDEIMTRVQRAAEVLHLAELLQRKPRQLSGGQRQRVAMGRAIVREPAVFLFDEPLSNLDAKLRVQMRVEIRRLHETIRTTSIYVTHDQVEAMTLADRLIVMNQGRVEQIGAPMAVYAAPATTFVAGFIGSPAMNMRPARLSADGAAIELADGRLPLAHKAAGAGGPVTLGMRPEHLRLAQSDDSALPLVVDLVEALGADTLVHGHLTDGAVVTVRLDGEARVRHGESLRLACAPQHLHLFDPASGARL